MLRSRVIRIRFALSDSDYFNAHSKRILVRTYILMRIVSRIKQSLRPNNVTFNSQYQLTFNLKQSDIAQY